MLDGLLRGGGAHVLVNRRAIVSDGTSTGDVASALLRSGHGTHTIAITVTITVPGATA